MMYGYSYKHRYIDNIRVAIDNLFSETPFEPITPRLEDEHKLLSQMTAAIRGSSYSAANGLGLYPG